VGSRGRIRAPGGQIGGELARLRLIRVYRGAGLKLQDIRSLLDEPRGDAAGDVDEDDAAIAAFQELAARHPDLLLILAPRRPERFDTAAGKLEAAGIRYLRRSRLRGSETLALPAVLLLDTIGELSGLFSVADAVFMGGTLARRGGHNILEPAFFAKPVIAGPHMENFGEIAESFTAAGNPDSGMAAAGRWSTSRSGAGVDSTGQASIPISSEYRGRPGKPLGKG